jgi:epoxide hydrolase 4
MESDYASSYIHTNGVNLHVIQAGPETGKPVILLHGFPEYWYGWQKQIGPLAEAGLRLIVPDQRGFNLSDKPQEIDQYRMDILARDVIELMDALGLERASLVGHDWGGMIAWVTAALYPERVERMAILNAHYPRMGLRTLLRHPQQILKSSYILFFQIPGLPEAILRNNDWAGLVRTMRRSSQPGTFSEADFEQYRRAWWRKGAITSMLNWYRAFLRRRVDLPSKPRFKMPVLVLWGVKDLALGRELAEASLDLCEDGELVYFEGATHWVQHEEHEAINRYLVGFLV